VTGHSDRAGIRVAHSALQVSRAGAGLTRLKLAGVEVLEPVADDRPPELGNGIIMAPWTNRVRDGRWTDGEQAHQLELSELARGNAIHGFARHLVFALVDSSATHLVLEAMLTRQPGWPFTVRVAAEYHLGAAGLTVTYRATNLDTDRAPWAVGAHPYFRIGDTPLDHLRLRVDAEEWLELDARLNPIANRPIDTFPHDLRAGWPVGDTEVNTTFSQIPGADLAVLGVPGGTELRVWGDNAFRWIHVFTPRQAIALEPMTAPPDALNSGTGLAWIEPGCTWEGRWGVELRLARAVQSESSSG
jgi:aldose 1-epimerase